VGLVTSQNDGRVRSCAFVPQAMTPMKDWLDEQRSNWEARLGRLDNYLTQLTQEGEE